MSSEDCHIKEPRQDETVITWWSNCRYVPSVWRQWRETERTTHNSQAPACNTTRHQQARAV